MAHVPAQAQDFVARSTDVFDLLIAAGAKHAEQWVLDAAFAVGGETVSDADLVNSLYAGGDPAAAIDLFNSFEQFIAANQELIVKMQLLKRGVKPG